MRKANSCWCAGTQLGRLEIREASQECVPLSFERIVQKHRSPSEGTSKANVQSSRTRKYWDFDKDSTGNGVTVPRCLEGKQVKVRNAVNSILRLAEDSRTHRHDSTGADDLRLYWYRTLLNDSVKYSSRISTGWGCWCWVFHHVLLLNQLHLLQQLLCQWKGLNRHLLCSEAEVRELFLCLVIDLGIQDQLLDG